MAKRGEHCKAEFKFKVVHHINLFLGFTHLVLYSQIIPLKGN